MNDLPELTERERAAMNALPADFIDRILRGERPLNDPAVRANIDAAVAAAPAPPLQIVTFPDPLSPEKRREIEGALAQLKCGPLTILSDQPVTFERVTPAVLRRLAAHFSAAELAEAGLCRLDQPATVEGKG